MDNYGNHILKLLRFADKKPGLISEKKKLVQSAIIQGV